MVLGVVLDFCARSHRLARNLSEPIESVSYAWLCDQFRSSDQHVTAH